MKNRFSTLKEVTALSANTRYNNYVKACKETATNVIPLKPKLKNRLPWENLYICQKREILHQIAYLKIHSQTRMKENKRNMLLEKLKKYKTQLIKKNRNSPGNQLTKFVKERHLIKPHLKLQAKKNAYSYGMIISKNYLVN